MSGLNPDDTSWEDIDKACEGEPSNVVRCRVSRGGSRATIYHEDYDVVAVEFYAAHDKSGVYLMGVPACSIEHERNITLVEGEEMFILRYVLTLNGVKIMVKEFASNAQGRLGRLLREWQTPLGEPVLKEYKK